MITASDYWLAQQARNLRMAPGECAEQSRFVIWGSAGQAAPANLSRSTNVNWPVVEAMGGAGFHAELRYR